MGIKSGLVALGKNSSVRSDLVLFDLFLRAVLEPVYLIYPF